MADEDKGFLARWSRLKRSEQAQHPTAPAGEPVPAESSLPAATAPAAEEPAEPADPNTDLPPIESLDRYSDYTVFLRKGVAPDLRKQALAKLWRSDPVFANLDGLLEYGEDYSLPFKTPQLVTTLYQVGKGMVDPAAEEPDAADASRSAETTSASEDVVIASPPEDALQEDDPADARPVSGDAADSRSDRTKS